MLKYKQWKHKIQKWGDSDLNKMSLAHKITIVADLMETPLDEFIAIAANNFGYEGTTN